jgi:hypothetical protein
VGARGVGHGSTIAQVDASIVEPRQARFEPPPAPDAPHALTEGARDPRRGREVTGSGPTACYIDEVLTQQLADTLVLDSLLAELRRAAGPYELVEHWQQGEFHHDVVLRIDATGALPGPFVVVATNCNGGVKEVLCLAELPTRGALWKYRCPENPEFDGRLAPILARAITSHWFDPCELLGDDARSELLEEFRERQPGGGWKMKGCGNKRSG